MSTIRRRASYTRFENPLTVLLGHLQLAAADERIRPNLQQTMHVVDQSARQIEHVLTDFVHYIETKKIRPVKTSLRQVIEDAMLMMGVHAQDKGVTLILEPGEPVELLMDASKMSQVFINLYKNSIEAIDAEATDKRVTTVITRQANELVVTIGDTGRGVPSHLVDALFQPFRTDKAGGMMGSGCRFVTASSRHTKGRSPSETRPLLARSSRCVCRSRTTHVSSAHEHPSFLIERGIFVLNEIKGKSYPY